MAPGPVGANPGSRISLPRVSKGDIPLLMPYVYVLVLGVAIYSLNSDLLVGSGALDARFSLVVPLALVAFGQTLVMFTRGIDLSVGGVISLVSALLATHLTAEGGLLILELLGIVALAVCIGALNGILISTARLQPFIVTLATWSIWGGVAFWLLPVEGGTPSPDLVSSVLGNVLGVPKSVVGRGAALPALVLAEADPFHHRPDRDRQRRGAGAAARRPSRPAQAAGLRLLRRRSPLSPASG